MGITEFISLAALCAPYVAPQTLLALADVESNLHPYAIHDGATHRALFLNTRSAAAAKAKALRKRGHRLDLGLMQINSINLRWVGLSIDDAFDPCESLRAGAFILEHNYKTAIRNNPDISSAVALKKAISMYNTGSPRKGFTNGYVRKVRTAATKYRVPAIEGEGPEPARKPPVLMEAQPVKVEPQRNANQWLLQQIPDGFTQSTRQQDE